MRKQLTIIVSLAAVLSGHTFTASNGMEISKDIGNWTASYTTPMGTITHMSTRILVDFQNSEQKETPNGFSYNFQSGSTSYKKLPFVVGEEDLIPGFVPESTLTLIPESKQSDFEDALRKIGWIK